MPARCRAARTFQDELAAHELTVVFADGAFRGCEAGVGAECALGPLPNIAEYSAASAGSDSACLVELVAETRVGGDGEIFPFRFGRKPRSRPAGECIGLEIGDVGDGRRPIDLAPSAEREFSILFTPVERSGDGLALDPIPTF